MPRQKNPSKWEGRRHTVYLSTRAEIALRNAERERKLKGKHYKGWLNNWISNKLIDEYGGDEEAILRQLLIEAEKERTEAEEATRRLGNQILALREKTKAEMMQVMKVKENE